MRCPFKIKLPKRRTFEDDFGFKNGCDSCNFFWSPNSSQSLFCNMQFNVLNDLAEAKRRWTEKKWCSGSCRDS